MKFAYLNVYKYTVIVALGGFIFGLDAAIISGIMRYIAAQFSLSNWQIGALVGAPSLGAMFALVGVGRIADAYGRKRTMLVVAGLYVVSACMSALASSFSALLLARMLGGVAFCALSLASLYIGEIAPAQLRGKLVSANQLSIVIGLLLAYLMNACLVSLASESQYWLSPSMIWRLMFAIELLPALLWFFSLFFIVESPRWLLLKQQTKQARLALETLYKGQEYEAIFTAISATIKGQTQQLSAKAQLKQLFSKPMRKIFYIALVMAITQGATGMNVILFYAPTVFEQVGLGVNASFQQAIYIGLTSLVSTLLAFVLLDKLGRRPLLLVGLVCIVLSHAACWYGFSSASYEINQSSLSQLQSKLDVAPLKDALGMRFNSDAQLKAFLATRYDASTLRLVEGHIIESTISVKPMLILIGILCFIAAYNFSLGPIMWVLFSEIFPNRVRGVALPLFSLVASVGSYIVQQLFPWQLANFGAANVFLMYLVAGVLGLYVMALILPETKNRTIEELENLLLLKGETGNSSKAVA